MRKSDLVDNRTLIHTPIGLQMNAVTDLDSGVALRTSHVLVLFDVQSQTQTKP